MATFRLSARTKDRLGEIGGELGLSMAGVIEYLVDEYGGVVKDELIVAVPRGYQVKSAKIIKKSEDVVPALEEIKGKFKMPSTWTMKYGKVV